MTTTFQIIQFSPVPEQAEFINIALLVHDGPRIVFDKRFPKLGCLRSGFDKALLADYISYWQNCVRDMSPDLFRRDVLSGSSQFCLGKENHIHGPIDERIEQQLIAKFLSHGDRVNKQGRYDRYIATKISDYLHKYIGIEKTQNILKQAPPKRFLSAEAYHCLGSNGFKIARVINGSDELLLMDGVSLGKRHDPKRAQERATHIAYMFFRIKKIKEEIKKIERRDVHSAALIFDDDASSRDPHAEFALDVLDRNADIVQYASQAQGRLSDIAARAIAHPFAMT